MNTPPISIKDFIKTFFLGLTITFIIIFLQLNNRQTRLVFCDVGQGDGAYIRIKNRIDVVVDAGPDRRILNCLGKHMPFWDRKIELVILSHHDKDHYGGFINIIDRYQIDSFLTIDYRFDLKTYKQLEKKIKDKHINYQHAYQGENIEILNDMFRFYWPPIDLKSYDSNDYSLVFLFQEKDFKVLFTGDASPFVINRLLNQPINNINILKIPHHGSKNGLTQRFLELADPNIGVISVGKNNSYGHPSKKVLDMLEAKNVKIERTDMEGDIVFKLPN